MPAPATRFVLIEPSHAGNVGATARAMKVMGFDELVLVRPRWDNVLRRKEAIERASGAGDVLQNARIVPTLDEALAGCTHLCATVMTARDFGPPTRSPRAHFHLLLKSELPAQAEPALQPDGPVNVPEKVAFLFGTERYGMANEDVYRCHAALQIPTNPQYGSLNLAAAVQLIAYDWRQALDELAQRCAPHAAAPTQTATARASHHQPADAAQVAGMLAHWHDTLIALGFLNPAAPKKLMPRLQQLANRAQPSAEEIHILRGIAKAVQTHVAAGGAAPSCAR